MSLRSTRNVQASDRKAEKSLALTSNAVAYLLIGVVFVAFLVLSAMNDYLFFEWLATCSFIVFALIGIHFIGQKQVKRNTNYPYGNNG